MHGVLARDCAAIRRDAPLIHCITNYVAMEFNADALLAIGASPLMSFCPEEADDLERAAAALVINIGCLDSGQIAGMKAAAAAALKYGKPWVLDPVGAGASTLRTRTCVELISDFHPAIIRGNASEILALSGISAPQRGADAIVSSADAVEPAKSLARSTGAVVSVSGETDYVTDGQSVESVSGGSPLQARVTAMGCTATVLTAAFAAVNPCALEAAAEAMTVMAVCGERAALGCKGTGDLRTRFIDCLSTF